MAKNVLVPDQIFTIDNILSSSECAEYIALAENLGYAEAPINTFSGPQVRPSVRNNRRAILDDVERAADLWQRVSEYIPKKIDRWEAIELNERFRFYRYDPGQYFAPHYDGCYRRENCDESMLTFMVYLNEDFVGGETRFDLRYPWFEVSVIPKTGMGLCFLHELRHEGVPVTEGRKYVLRSDVMYRFNP